MTITYESHKTNNLNKREYFLKTIKAQQKAITYHGMMKSKSQKTWISYPRTKNKACTIQINVQVSLTRKTKHKKNILEKKYERIRLELAKRTH